MCVYGTCSDCCRPGGVCDTAYKNGSAICCGGSGCCPTVAMCVRCEHGVHRCAFPPFAAGCQHTRRHEIDEDTAFLLLVFVGLCMIGACWLHPHCCHSPSSVAPAANVVASSPMTDSFATGLLEGVLLTDVLHDHSPEPEPPSYVESSFEADV